VESYFKELNSQQLAAVKADGHVLILACPGSGKTRVLTRKIAFELHKEQNSKKWLVALTFTNRAAEEIQRRVDQFDIETKRLWSGTIHSFCLEWILRSYAGNHDGTENGFTLIDEIDTDNLLAELKKKHFINRYDNVRATYNLDGTFNLNNPAHFPVVEEYKATLRSRKQIDFDDILLYSYQLLIKHPVIALRLSNIFSLICVDEYQDTQELQYAILAEIAKAGKGKTRMYFVGDICQAIYGSLGGVAKNKAQIESQFGIELLARELSGNYRSNQRIIDFYSLFQVEPMTIAAKSKIAGNRGIIHYNHTVDKNAVDTAIAELIQDQLAKGVPAAEICVIAPWWDMILPMGRKLKSHLPQVDFDAFGLSPFRRVRDNIWHKVVRLYLTTSGGSNTGLRRKWADELLEEIDHIIPAFLSGIENRRRHLLRTMNQFSSSQTNSMTYIEKSLQYFLHIFSINLTAYSQLSERKHVFDKALAEQLAKEQYDYANDVSVMKRLFNSKNGVVVSTCHGVKGEEYETVIAFGILDGCIPNDKEPDREDAALKMLYVMFSRAKNNLFLFSERGRTRNRIQQRIPTTQLSRITYDYD
jgi:DNA helicase-2/ATP-dependent DNA helicase PcrA